MKHLQILAGSFSDFTSNTRSSWVHFDYDPEPIDVRHAAEINGERTTVEHRAVFEGREVRYVRSFFCPLSGHASNGSHSLYDLDGTLLV